MSKVYQYMLNENAVNNRGEIIESMQIEGISVSQNVWMSMHSQVRELEKYIMTKKNPKGIVDYREYRTDSDTIIYSSRDALVEVPEKIYSFEELSLMDKNDLIKIARMYNISLIGKTPKRLTKDILSMQVSLLEKKKTSV